MMVFPVSECLTRNVIAAMHHFKCALISGNCASRNRACETLSAAVKNWRKSAENLMPPVGVAQSSTRRKKMGAPSFSWSGQIKADKSGDRLQDSRP
jgi:hypothetical protein